MADFAPTDIPPHWGMTFTETIYRDRNPSTNPANVTLSSGYTVVVTGAGKLGIGEYIAKAYVEAKVENIIITSRTQNDLERVRQELRAIAKQQKREVNVAICVADATKPEDYEKIGEILSTSYGGRLDCLVLNAGGGDVSKADRPLHEGDLDLFRRVTELNYTGQYYGMMVLLPYLLKGPGKTLINIVSGAAHLIDTPPASYNVAKLALIRMTEIIASMYAKDNLACFALHPGAVPTPIAVARAPMFKNCRLYQKIMTDDVHPAGDACVWLSDRKPMWASGRYISSTWDMKEFEEMKEDIIAGDKLKFRMVV